MTIPENAVPAECTDRDIALFLKGMQHAIQISQSKPKRVSALSAIKMEMRELSLRRDLAKGISQ